MGMKTADRASRDEILTTEAARMLGVSDGTVYNYVERGLLHPRRVGHIRAFRREEVEHLARRLKRGTSPAR